MSRPDSLQPFSFLRTGAVIQSWYIEGIDIVLGFPTEELYQAHNHYYFGATLGRVANRIKGARLTNLNGRDYSLQPNEGPNILHAGVNSWGHKIWEGPTKVPAHKINDLEGVTDEQSIQFQLLSEDMDEGFPGTVLATIIYTAGWQVTSQGERVSVLELSYEAELLADAEETVINMTNHSYFNISGNSTITGTQASICTTKHLPKDSENIPISGPVPFPGIQAKTPFIITESWPVIDHCFVVNASPDTVPLDTRLLALQKNVEAYHPDSNIHLEVWGTEPAFQLYTGENTNVPAVGGCPSRGPRSAFCVEPERYVNAPEVEAWRKMVLLKKGETYGSRIVYRAWKTQMA